MKKNILILSILTFTIGISSCETSTQSPGRNYVPGNSSGAWLIPQDQVRDGGPGKDGIPAIDDPILIPLDDPSNDYLQDEDLVLGFYHEGEVVAYPHDILDWHEIINDKVGGQAIAVTYCPLTGTGIGWDRVIDLEETTFGVSGLLYNSNLIPYDRNTGSNWSQIRMECVNGPLISTDPVILPLVEMPWKTWKKFYPESRIVSTETGHSRSYGSYPYGNYKTRSSLIFPAIPADDRLHLKERVMAVIIRGEAKAYRFEDFGEDFTVIHDNFSDTQVVIAGIRENFMVALNAMTGDGQELTFTAGPEAMTLLDQEGNEWNLFGVAVSGPRKGEQLKPLKSFMGYWFSIAAFYPEPLIYNE